MCLSNIEVIGQSMSQIQLPVSENKGIPKFKSRSHDLPLDPFDLICIFSVMAPRPQ